MADGRIVAFDDVGDSADPVVVYLHGTPDSRLARHPDDAVTVAAGVRLIALDRPGAGDSDLDPAGTLQSLGDDIGALLDHLGVERAILLGWSAGALFGLGAASVLGDRVRGIGLVGAVPPVEAYADPAVVSSLGPARRAFVEMAADATPTELAAELVPYLVPDPLTPGSAREHVHESVGDIGRHELDAVPGAEASLVAALQASVAQGTRGLALDVAAQLQPGVDLAAVRAPVRTFHGTLDPVSPPEVGAWLVARLPDAVLDRVPGGGHHLLFPRWRGILRSLLRDAVG